MIANSDADWEMWYFGTQYVKYYPPSCYARCAAQARTRAYTSLAPHTRTHAQNHSAPAGGRACSHGACDVM